MVISPINISSIGNKFELPAKAVIGSADVAMFHFIISFSQN